MFTPGDCSVGGVLTVTGLTITVAHSGTTVTGVSISATSATLTLGGAVSSTITGISGSYTKASGSSAWTGGTFSLTLGQSTAYPSGSLSFGISSFVNVTATSANVTFIGGNSSSVTLNTITTTPGSSTATTVTQTTASLSELTIGITNATIFVGINGGTSTAAGVSLNGVNVALALFSGSGTTYYGLRASATAITPVGILSGFALSTSNLEADVNGASSGSAVVDFDHFNPGTGLAVNVGSGTVNLDFQQALVQAAGTVTLQFGSFIYITGSMTFQQGTIAVGTTLNLTNNTTTTVVSTLEIGAGAITTGSGNTATTTGGVTVFAGINGPPGTGSNPVGVELTQASLALALITGADGFLYYGVKATAGTFGVVGLPSGFNLSTSDLAVSVNGSNNSAASLNFGTTFSTTIPTYEASPAPATKVVPGLAVPLNSLSGGASVVIDFTNPLVQVSGTVLLNLDNFIYISGSLYFQTGPIATSSGTTINLSGGGTTNLTSILEIGGSNITIFAGINGPTVPASNNSPTGIQLTNANFGVALITASNGNTYYGVTATADSLAALGLPSGLNFSGSDLKVEVNGANTGTAAVNFDSTFVAGTGLAIPTGPGGTPIDLDFQSSYLEVAGTVNFQLGSFFSVTGGFDYTQTAGTTEIQVNNAVVTFGSGSTVYFSATANLDLTLTATTTTIGNASLTVDETGGKPGLNIPDILTVLTPTIMINNLSIDDATGKISGTSNGPATLTITAASATLLPGNSTVTASVTASTGTGADGLGLQGTFNLQTGAFNILLEQFSLQVGSLLTANASGVTITYSPTGGSGQQLVSISNGTVTFNQFSGGTGSSSSFTGNVTDLVIYGNGFQFGSLTLAYTGTINIGSILTVTDPSVTLTNFSVTFGGGNATFTETGSMTVAVGSASLDIGSGDFSASATTLSITVSLDPLSFGTITASADTVTFKFGSYVTMEASTVRINTDPGESNINTPGGPAYLSVGSATVTLSLGSGPSLTGTATNFSVIESDGTDGATAGAIELREDTGFGISITADPGSLHLPSWLGFQITQFTIQWPDFATDPANFTLILSASITSIQGLPSGVQVSGEITDAVINVGMLEHGEFPITSIGSIGGSVSGMLFGLQVNASFVLGIVNLNAENQIVNVALGTVTDPTTGATVTNGDTAVVSSTMYVGVAGGAMIPGVGGVEIYIGFSSLGPLTVYVSAQFPLILDPDTGLAIGGFSGGVMFDYSLPTPNQPTDLRTLSLSPAGISLSAWQQQLEMQTITQVAATSAGLSAYSQPFVIEAGVTLYDAYLTQDSFKISGNIAIEINPSAPNETKIFVAGTATLGNSVSFNAYLYADLDVQGAATTASFMFLVDEPASTPVESFGGALKFGFTDSSGNAITPAPPTVSTSTQTITLSDGTTRTYTATTFIPAQQTIGGFYISLSGFLEYSALGFASVSISGGVTLTVTGTEAKLDLLGTLNVSFLGDIATAQGEFVIQYGGSTPQFYGALEVSTGAALAKLQTYGLTVDGAILFQINTTGVNQTVYLPNAPPANSTSTSGVTAPALGTSNATPFVIQGPIIFDLTITGTSSPYATISYEVNNTTLFQMQGFFDLRLTNDPTNGLGLEMFADINSLTIGSGATKFLSFSGFGLFLINSQGLAAEINLTLNSGNAISGVSFNANFQLVINTTSQAITFTIPSVTVPTSTSGSTATADITVYNADGSVAGTVTSLVIPAGPPQGSLQDINNAGAYAVTGAAGPYVVISGVGSLSLEGLSLNGYFYFQVSDSSTGGFVLELVLSVTGNIPSVGTASVTGALEISSAGEVALLAIGGSGGTTTSYGSGISLQVSAELAVNTTSSDVSEIGGVPLTYNGNKVTVAANSVQVIASGTLSLNLGGGTGFVISGTFSTTVTTAGGITATAITLNGTLTATVGGTTLLTMNASGVLVVTSGGVNPGVAGELSLTLAGSDPLDGNGFVFNGTFDLEVNTTGVKQTVSVSGTTTTIAAGPGGSTNGGSYIQVHAHGNLVFGSATNGFQLNNGDFYILVGTSGLAVSASAALTIEAGGSQIFYAAASGGMVVTSSGIAASITVTATLNDPSGSGLYAISGTFSLQANTTGVQQTIGSGPSAIVIAAGPGATGSPAGPYFQLYVSGTLVLGGSNATSSTGLFVTGNFYLAVGTAGITIAADGTLTATVGGNTLLTMTAIGGLIITTAGSNPGLAGELTLTFSGNSPLDGNGFGFTGSFNLQVNTTAVQQTVTIGTGSSATTTTISAGPNGSSVGGAYFEVDATGSLIFGSATDGFNLGGSFFLSVGTTGLVVAANVSFTANVGGTTLLTMTANGVLILTSGGSNPGLAGELTLTLNGADPLDGNGFTFNGSFALEINTTLALQTVTVGTGSSAITTTISAGPNGSTTGGVYFQIYAAGNLVFGTVSNGFFLNSASLYLVVSSGGLAVSASATLGVEVGGTQLLSAAASGGMIISTAGFAASLTVTVASSLNDPSGGNLYAFSGTFTLQVNTTGVQQTIGSGPSALIIPAGPGPTNSPTGPYFQLYVSGTLALGTTSATASSGLFVAGNFYLVISTSGLMISANGTLTAVVANNTLLTMTASGGLILNVGGADPGLAGELTLTLSAGNPLSGTGFSFNGSFNLQINTTGAQQTVTAGTLQTVISAGPGGSTAGSPYFQVAASGAIVFGTASNGFALSGSFFLSIGTTGLFISTNVSFKATVLGATLLTMNASGAMEITANGLAASFTLSVSGGGSPFSLSNAFSFSGAFTFQINTTNQVVTDQIGTLKLNLPKGPYFQVAITGPNGTGNASLTLGSSVGLELDGSFDLTISSNGLAVTATAQLTLLSLISFQADGALLITPNGIAAKITLTLGTGLSGSDFSFDANFLLEVNSTNAAVSKINNLTVNLPQGPYFEILGNGNLTLEGVASLTGSFEFEISNGSVVIGVNAVIDVFGIYFTANGFAAFSSQGLALSIGLSVGTSSNPTVTIIPGVLGLSGSFVLEVNTTNSTTFTVNGTTYTVALNTPFDIKANATVNLFGFSVASVGLDIKLQNNLFTAQGFFSFNLFSLATFNIDFYFDSGGNYYVYGGASVQLGSNDFNVHGSLTVEAAGGDKVGTTVTTQDYGNVVLNAFSITISGGVTAFGWNFASISANLTISPTYDVSVSVYVSVSFYFFSIGGTVTIDLGQIGPAPAPPPPPALGTVLTSPTTIDGESFGSGTLLLDLGQYADSNRGVPAQPTENYTITYVGPGANGTEDIDVSAPGVYSKMVEYDNISEIVVPNADFGTGTSNVILNISNGVTLPVVVFSGSGTNVYTLGGGTTTVNGTDGVDTVYGGSGSVTFNVGGGTSTFLGGTANNTINNDPGDLTVVQGDTTDYSTSSYNTYDLNGDVLSYSNGGQVYSDTINGPATIELTTPTSGTATFTVENYQGTTDALTVNGNGNPNAILTVTNTGNISLVGSQVVLNGGAIVLENVPTVSLVGSTSGDQLTVTNSADIPTVNLAGDQGSDLFTINDQGGIDYTVNVTGAGSGNTLVVNGTGTNNTYSITATQISLAGEVVKYAGIQSSILNAKNGNDIVNVQSINNATTVNLGVGTNIVNVGTLAPTVAGGTLNNIRGLLTVTGGHGGTDTIYLDDSGDGSNSTATLTTSTLAGIFGSGGSLAYSGIGNFNLFLGNGSHTMNVQGMSGVVNISLGSGANTINIGSNAGTIVTDPTTGDSTNTGSTLDAISGMLTLTGTGANTFNLDDSGSLSGVEGAMTPTTITFLNTSTLLDLLTINLPTLVAANIALSQGGDLFAITDTFTSAATTPVIVIDGNGGNDTFVILDTHAVMTINGGDGDDGFYNFGNSAVLYMNGDAGDDTFYIYASINENTTNVGLGAGSGSSVYTYRVNSPVYINGGTGSNKVYIFGTQYGDVITINGNQVTGAGIDVNFTNIEQLYVVGLGGNNIFYIESITIPTTIYGNGTIVPAPSLNILQALNVNVPVHSAGTPGSNTFYVGWQGASYIPGSLANFTAPLTIYGDNGPNPDGTTTTFPGTVNTVYVDDSADVADTTLTLTSTMLTGSAFGTGGSLTYDSAVNNLNIHTGSGDNTITIDGTGAGSQTSIYGGAGNDEFIVNTTNSGSLESPLALFGGLNTFPGDTLTVNGAPAGNTFNITGFTIDGAGATISYEEMELLTINAGGNTVFNVNGDSIPTDLIGGPGSDIFNINSNVVPLDLTGGTSTNVFNVNANAGTLIATGGTDGNTFTVNGNSGTFTITGGVGNDVFTFNGNSGTLVATGSSNANIVVVNANSGSLAVTGGVTGNTFIVNGNSGMLTLTGGTSVDSFTVNALSSAATINGGGGDDLFNVTGPLNGALTVNGSGTAGSLLTIDGSPGNDSVTITGTTVNGIGSQITYNGTNLTIDGVSGNDSFLIDGTSSFITRIVGGTHGNDVFNVQATTGALYLTGGLVGNNTFNLGSLAPVSGGVLTGIAGPVYITGGSNVLRLITLASMGINTINVDDSGDTVNNLGTLTSSTLIGLGLGAGLTYNSVNVLNISLGLGNDIFNVQSTNLKTRTTLYALVNTDVINVGSNAPAAGGLVSGIQGALIIVGSGTDTLNVDDTGDTAGQIGTLTSTMLTGLSMGTAGITYSGLAVLNVNLGSGNDTFNVQSTVSAAVTTLNTGAGNNVINVGSTEPAAGGLLGGIQGSLIIVGSGMDTMNVDDTGDSANEVGALSATTLTGEGMGTAGITYSGLTVLNINLGSGNDTFTITGVTNSTATTIDGKKGTNTAVIDISDNFAGQNLTLLNFATASLAVSGNFSGLFNDPGALTTVTIGGSITPAGVFNAGSVGTMTVGGDLAGLLDVTGALGTLTVDGGTPGTIIAGSVQVIKVLAGYGNSLLNLTVNGIQREILATPVAGGTMPTTVHFAFVYDAETAVVPQVAIRITDTNPVARTYNLALIVVNSATATFDLSRIDSYNNGKTGIGNISVQGDLLTQLTAPELQVFTNLTASSKGGVVLPADSIIGLELSGKLPIGFVNVAGLEGLAFSVVTTAAGTPVSVSTPLGQGSSLTSLLGTSAVVIMGNGTFVVPFAANGSVRFFVHDDTSLDLNQVLTLTDEMSNGQPITALVRMSPTSNNSINGIVQSIALIGSGGSIVSTLSIANITSTGPLGAVTITANAGPTVNNAPGLGNVTAPSIFGSINVTDAPIYGVIQTTSGDIGQVITGANGQITGVTTIFTAGAITGQIISRGNLVSSVKANGALTGVIAAQGDIGAIQRNTSGSAVTNGSNALTRFGGISIGGNFTGQIIVLGNVFGDMTVTGTVTGRITVNGQAVAGLVATRIGILGNISIASFAAGGAIVSDGLVGDATGGTTVYLASPHGFVAAAGGVNLRSTTLASGTLLQNQTGANLAAIKALFTNAGLPLLFDTGGSLIGLTLIETDLTNIHDNGGALSGTIS